MEEYKTITGYENLYLVSNHGNIKSINSLNTGKDRILKQEVIKRPHTNYRRVSLSKGGVVKRYHVHQLVAKSFLKDDSTRLHVNHKDNNGENNHFSNLEWCTHQENMLHAQKQGRLTSAQTKAGLASGIISRKSAIKRISEYIGTTVNGWKILKAISYGKHPRVEAKCPVCHVANERSLSDITDRKIERCLACYRARGSRKPIVKKKKVLQFTKDGKLLNEYISTEAARAAMLSIGNLNSKIKACCDNKRKSSCGYIWKYKDEDIV